MGVEAEVQGRRRHPSWLRPPAALMNLTLFFFRLLLLPLPISLGERCRG
jgi:hypothetical protein